MSRCCGNDSRQPARRSGPLTGAWTILRRWLWLILTLLVIVVAWVWFTFGPGKVVDQAAALSTFATTERIEGPRTRFDETYYGIHHLDRQIRAKHGKQPVI